MKTLAIDRSKWLCGTTRNILGRALMVNECGHRCCLGFEARRLGVSDSMMLDRGGPLMVTDYRGLLRMGGLVEISDGLGAIIKGARTHTRFTMTAMQINDKQSPDYFPEQREADIAELFLGKDVLVEFVGEYPKAGQKRES